MTQAVASFWTYTLITVGGLTAALCGSCTAYVVLISLGNLGDYGSLMLVMAPFIGGVPTVIGALLLSWGLRRRARAKAALGAHKDVF